MVKQPEKSGAAGWLVEYWPIATIFLAIYSFAFIYLFLYMEN